MAEEPSLLLLYTLFVPLFIFCDACTYILHDEYTPFHIHSPQEQKSRLPPACRAMPTLTRAPFRSYVASFVLSTQVAGTHEFHPSEIIVTLAYGDVETYARKGGREPTATEFDWKGGRVLRLPGWSVPYEGDMVVVMVNATSDARYRVLAASDGDVLRLEDGMPVQMLQDESEMRCVQQTPKKDTLYVFVHTYDTLYLFFFLTPKVRRFSYLFLA